ncbi:MAG TPA: 4-hydroxythreonine-4-phosphate dehydrogenase PdxA, partial [Blastocatellia bacterium]|nr:4-hydroxythreonine-4-phosphate dehydrogenase PdxA [Blastocatellia bacterium]
MLKSITEPEVCAACRPIIIGDAKELRRQALALSLPCDYCVLSESDLISEDSLDPVIYDTGDAGGQAQWGCLSADAGRAAIAAIEAGVKLCLSGKLDAIATAPINKESLKLAGSRFPGHTEMLTSLCGASRSLMCFFAGDLRVFLLTIHMSLADAIKAITKERVADSILLADRELRRFGIPRPRIAVAGLNPHAGEHGLFGSEEAREIEPAIEECRAQHKIQVSGPFPADTLFVRAARGEFDA